jgi:hypothetical protein
LPPFKEEILGQTEDVLKKALTSAALLSDFLVGRIDHLQDGMKQKSD